MENNPELQLAWQFIENTGTHLFLTGKAGTGKTTFLRQLKAQSPKRMVVIAPTGIAAINAAGVTMHSFFQLPFAPYVPDTTFTSAQAFHKFGKEKINIIRSMDLLVIDEISMVRADLLDAVDAVLRRYRDRYKPFGGVQLLMIGDLQQLAPVVRDDDWRMLAPHYDTAFFFGSHALRETEYVTIELKKVYRQSDIVFLNLLNKIRDKQADDSVLAELNKRYLPDFRPKEEEGYIRLTTHNHQAQRYNDRQLEALPDKAFGFKAQIEKLFPSSAYPADEVLTVKRGAQIMFIKNDSSGDKRYYNGKIGRVTDVRKDSLSVCGNDEGDAPFLLSTEEWTNSKYSLNPLTKEITEEVEGTFQQYPIRLAWAITIHKSQGLTFERAIIDANASFAHGQVYVALSRCKTLEGLVLGSALRSDSIISDDVVDNFTREAEAQAPDKAKLQNLQRHYFYELLCEQFDFHLLERHFSLVLRLLDEHLYRLYPKVLERYKQADELFKAKIAKVADTFQTQYTSLFSATEEYAHDTQLHQRLVSGARYFGGQLDEILLSLVAETTIQTDNKELKKKFSEALDVLQNTLCIKRGTLLFTEQEGFRVSSYLKHKAILSISSDDSPVRKSAAARGKSAKIEVPMDILHPELYKQIIAWRSTEGSKVGLPLYTIIQQKAILGIVNLLPADIPSLIRIPYFGKKGAEKYGELLLEMVNHYVKHQHVQRPDLPEASSSAEEKQPQEPKAAQRDTREVSFSLFKEGKSIEEIARERELVTGTIAGHLEPYLRSGEIKVSQLVAQEKIDKITRYLQKHSHTQGLTMLKVALGEDVSYADIKLVLASYSPTS